MGTYPPFPASRRLCVSVQLASETIVSPPDTSPRPELAAVRSLVCEFVHQQFIADPAVARLVHHQGYDSRLLPVVVRGIPSLHVCLDFLRELLLDPDQRTQIFAVRLAAALAGQYRLPKTLEIARAVLGQMHEMATALAPVREPYFRGTLPSLTPVGRRLGHSRMAVAAAAAVQW